MKRKHDDNSNFSNKRFNNQKNSAEKGGGKNHGSRFKGTPRTQREQKQRFRNEEYESKSFDKTPDVKTMKNPAVYDEDCHSYFKNALDTLKQGLDDDQKDIFIMNVLEQTNDQELQLSSQSVSSRCIEHLLELSNDLPTILRFMQAFDKNKEDAFGNPFASHITENLLYLGLHHLQNWSKDVEPDDDSEDSRLKAAQVLQVLTWIHGLGDFCLENLKTCLEDNHAAPVLRTLVHALGGYFVCRAVNQSKRAKEHKKFFERELLGEDYEGKERKSIELNEVPKFFIDILKKLSKTFLKLEDIKNHATEARTCGVVQSFLYVLKRRLPKRSKKFVRKLMQVLFEEKNGEGIPTALLHKNCSFVIEKVFESALEDLQEELWKVQISCHIEYLVSHPVGNYVVQRLFDAVASKALFEVMAELTMQFFPAILNARNYGIFLSIATTCNKLKSQQGPFMTQLMKCLQCEEPEERQIQLLPLLLALQTYDARKDTTSESSILITLQGSLLVQAVLKFQKPIKAVRSILGMKPEVLKFLACHVQGCHVLTTFVGSEHVGEKNKDKFLQHIKTVLAPLACDRSGSLTLSRIWVLLSLKLRGVIADEMSRHQNILRENQSGSLLLKKFGVFHYKKQYEQWKKFQEDLTDKRNAKD